MTSRGRFLPALGLGFVFLAVSASRELLALNPDLPLKSFLIRTWAVESGLPHGAVNALVQAHDGYLWIGMSSGLVRFDGVRFRTFTARNAPALKNDHILALHEDENDVLWVGTDGGGLASLNDGQWKSYTTENGLSNNRVRTIAGDGRGGIWAGTDFGLNRVGPAGIRVYTPASGLVDGIITALAPDSRGNLWVGTLRGGLAKFKDEAFRAYGFDEGLQSLFVHSLAADADGNVWVGTQEGLYFLKEGENAVRLIPGTAHTPVASLKTNRDGVLWVGTIADGLKRKTGRGLSGLASEDGLPDNYVRSLLPDRSGTLWLGTDAGGLVQLKEATARSITAENGLPENAVQAVMQDRAGFIWVATRSKGLAKIKDGTVVEIVDRTKGLSDERVRALLEDSEGRLWAGTEGSGLYRLRNGRAIRMDAAGDLPSVNVSALLWDRDGILWVGTDNGLSRWTGEPAGERGRAPELPGRIIRVLLQSRSGVIYVGAKDGLYRYSDRTFLRIIPAGGNSEIDVCALFEDDNGVLWIGTNGRGLLRWLDGTVVAFTKDAGLPDDSILGITADGAGDLWLSTGNGVLRIKREELNGAAGRHPAFVHAAWFDETDGMASRQCAGPSQPSCWRTGAGLILYPTVKGVAVFDPGRVPASPEAPEVAFEDILVGDRALSGIERASVRNAGKIIEFRFTGFDFTAPDKIRFRCLLEGDKKMETMIPPRADRLVRFVGLSPGRYRFAVTAAGNLGARNERGAAVEFRIPPPLFGTPVFYAAALLATLVLLGAGAYVRTRRRMRKAREKYKTSSLAPELAEQVASRLLRLLEEEKLYLNPGLSLRDLAQRLRIHSNHLSRIINERFGASFNDFVNRYRIEEAKRRLADPEAREASILDIALNSGFFSKSVFNTAFKKFVGTTPSEYRKRNS
jgi:ligand-binding sensor domain-containing protein/AraC-like DNA-binding protein